MKKEIFAFALLAAMIIASLINIGGIVKLTDSLTDTVSKSAEYSGGEDWEKAIYYIEQAIKEWNDNDSYTHIVLRHSEIDTLSDALYEYMSDVYEKNKDAAKGSSAKVLYHIESLTQMERIRFGSIF